MNRIAFLVVAALAATVAGGCGDDDGDTDAGRVDAGPGDDDAGPGRVDAGPGDEDAGPGDEDAGPGDEDAGPGDEDAGPGEECGDGTVDDDEECDDGDDNSDTEPDACRTDCTLPVCGDDVTDPGSEEECDTGDDRSDDTPDACRTDCTSPFCGDGVTDTGEACDDGNDVDDDECTNDCAMPTCGDGVLDEGEECDDGGTEDGDGCQGNCMLPVCGDGILDEDEECDDGDTMDDDVCLGDCTLPPPPCEGDADCDDGLFCNGAETCVEGDCVDGTAPGDDGVDCTVETCDEEADEVTSAPSDALCDDLDRAADCAGSLIQSTEGVCDPTDGCTAVVTTEDDCSSDDELFCGDGEIRARGSICVPATADAAARCEVAETSVEDCSDSIPSTHPFCDGTAADGDLTWHSDAVPVCSADGGAPACGFTESTDDCTGGGGAACADGELSTLVPTCDDAAGCGVDSTTESCPDTPSFCDELVLVTYAPTCADDVSCGDPAETRTDCVRAPECVGDVYTTYVSGCDHEIEECVARVDAEVDCPASATGTCRTQGGRLVYDFETCGCDAAVGCDCTAGTDRCTAPAAECTDDTTLRTYAPTCEDGAGCDVSTTDTDCGATGGTCCIRGGRARCC